MEVVLDFSLEIEGFGEYIDEEEVKEYIYEVLNDEFLLLKVVVKAL